MKRWIAGVALPALLACGAMAAAPPPHFDTQPPGQIVQDTVAYLSGEAMNSAWHVVVSRKTLGTQMGGEPAYQWYVSFYAPSARGLKLAYRLPNDAGNLILDTVVKAHGAQLYFPRQDVKIAGRAELERPGVQDVVVQTHQSGADCGSANVAVFGADAAMHVTLRANVQNGCRLDPALVKNGARAAVRLSGPYYAANAPMCCPTKPHASALLAFKNGKWTVTPAYFAIAGPPAERRSAARSIHR